MSVLAFVRPSKVARMLRAEADPHSPLSQDSLNGFGNAVLSITSYCNAVGAVSLLPPLPGKEPAWYQPLNTNLQNMKKHTQVWLDTIGPSMTAIPQAIINFNNTFEGQYDPIVALLKQIGTNSPTPEQKSQLLTEMNFLLSTLKAQYKTVSDANTSLIQFNDNLSADHTALTTGAASITEAIEFDKNDVTAMGQKIKTMQIAIDALQEEVTFAALGIGAGLFAGLIGIFVGFITFGVGVFIAVVGFAGAAASIGVLIAAEVQIKQAAQAIAEASNELSVDNQQIVALNSVASTVNLLVVKNGIAAQAMSTVLTDWASLTGKLEGVVKALEEDEGDIGTILDLGDMATTRLAWQELADFAQKLQNGLGNVAVNPKVQQPSAA